MVLGDGAELELAPVAAVNLDIKLTPTDVGFEKPALLIEAVQDTCDVLQTIERNAAPVIDCVERLGAVAQRNRVEGLAGGQWSRARQEPPLITCPAPNDG